ncbi:hypothetical protein SAMN04488020_107210 [Palleronia marisminoris]|uniref:Integral membrane protein TerC family protein n=1 Tax=Palleronia marisminoris TaxID=315423 RepID=A0A1Y5TAF5_9RHOB|nr:DUF475 domain-containing protein [Palleronia marisminoris]SFH17191.1 hypothetical protein SAMN04488020_107210 [Palleronia marisminoris]SLN55924.1 Integral membrane protein TerC family protein [Palleronia marisminoris]
MLSSTMRYFSWAIAVTVIGLALSLWVGWSFAGTLQGMLGFFFIATVLAALEISLSFDNAIVNANVLKRMSPVWQHRFLTWGIIIAVFGMRIVFPLAIVSIAAQTGPWQAVVLAAEDPAQYAHIMEEAHPDIAAFGGTFLLMVALSFFFDPEKDIHWLGRAEGLAAHHGATRGADVLVTVAVLLGLSQFFPSAEAGRFLTMAMWGLLTYLVVHAIGAVLDSAGPEKAAAQGGLGAFLYLEMLDASFSFDGVIGAFALTQNLFIIAIGLGIGAMYVRSMTIMLVEKGTLSAYRFLEHGAFYAIFVLAVIMFIQPLAHVPEVVTGLIGIALIGAALMSSIRWNRQNGSMAESPAAE